MQVSSLKIPNYQILVSVSDLVELHNGRLSQDTAEIYQAVTLDILLWADLADLIKHRNTEIFEPRSEKTDLRGFRPCLT